MILAETHNLDIENRGNRFVAQLRPARRLMMRLASKLATAAGPAIANVRALGARWSRAYFEHRLLKAALEVELYRGRYKHSNKNDDDLPIATDMRVLTQTEKGRSEATGIKGALPVIVAFAIFTVVLAGIVGLRAAIWLPGFYR